VSDLPGSPGTQPGMLDSLNLPGIEPGIMMPPHPIGPSLPSDFPGLAPPASMPGGGAGAGGAPAASGPAPMPLNVAPPASAPGK
jgi:hypothetical protein